MFYIQQKLQQMQSDCIEIQHIEEKNEARSIQKTNK